MVSSLESRHALHSMVSTIKVTTCRSSLAVHKTWIRVLIYESMVYRVSWSLTMSVQCLTLVRAVPASGTCLHEACRVIIILLL